MTLRFGCTALLLLAFGCAGQAQPLEVEDERTEQVAPPGDDGGEWAYLVIPNDREFDELAPITGSSHDPKEMPAGNIGTPDPDEAKPELGEKVRIKKCGTDADCPKPRACLRPTGGPHPYGVCGDAIDHLGRPTPNRIVRSCGVHLACPGGARCVLAYEDYGMCFK